MGLYNNFPNTDYHELNLDYLIADLTKLKEAFEGLTDESKAYTDLIRQELEAEMATLKETTSKELAETLSSVRLLIDNAEARFKLMIQESRIYTDKAIKTLSDEVDRKLAKVGSDVYNPVTGTYGTIESAINSLYGLHTDDALTAAEYDALELTAQVYDGKELTALEYDLKGKILLQ